MKACLVGHPSCVGHSRALTWDTVRLLQSDYVPGEGDNRDPSHWGFVSGHMVGVFDRNGLGMQSDPALLAGSCRGPSMYCKWDALPDGSI
jgi:hypothetical protein